MGGGRAGPRGAGEGRRWRQRRQRRRRRRRRRGEGTTGSRAGSRPARPRAVRRPARAPLGRRRGRCARGDRGAGGALGGHNLLVGAPPQTRQSPGGGVSVLRPRPEREESWGLASPRGLRAAQRLPRCQGQSAVDGTPSLTSLLGPPPPTRPVGLEPEDLQEGCAWAPTLACPRDPQAGLPATCTLRVSYHQGASRPPGPLDLGEQGLGLIPSLLGTSQRPVLHTEAVEWGSPAGPEELLPLLPTHPQRGWCLPPHIFFFFFGTRAPHRCGLSRCGAQALHEQAQRPWLTGPAALRHVGSSRTGARTHVSCIGRRTPNHCATREAPPHIFVRNQHKPVLREQTDLFYGIKGSPPRHCAGHRGRLHSPPCPCPAEDSAFSAGGRGHCLLTKVQGGWSVVLLSPHPKPLRGEEPESRDC
ncbi:uncharacterized protein [Pseudorca crassidens]|uniref:uncharacterized protein n=1 Tax=Pseudorca crassidens TaxID=82174 RepID=UPI00352ECC73